MSRYSLVMQTVVRTASPAQPLTALAFKVWMEGRKEGRKKQRKEQRKKEGRKEGRKD
jgi:hypothetical protein